MLVVAVPSGDVANTMRTMADHRVDTPPRIVVCASKGLEPERGLTMAEVIALNYPSARVAILSAEHYSEGLSNLVLSGLREFRLSLREKTVLLKPNPA